MLLYYFKVVTSYWPNKPNAIYLLTTSIKVYHYILLAFFLYRNPTNNFLTAVSRANNTVFHKRNGRLT